MGFLLVSVRTFFASEHTAAKTLLLALVALWAVRLWLHLVLRARGKPEDPRYQKFRAHYGAERYWWVSFFQVFLLQGVLLLIISLPLQVAFSAPKPDVLGWNDWLGATLFGIGFYFEAVGDWQLQRFRDDPSLRGTVLDSGLWRYSRHPNYFGETVIWWGFWLCALDAPLGLWLVASPALMTFLLLRVSGVTMLEAQLEAAKPMYRDYIRTTSAFVPWPKKH
jgi:steroid 5-alpha reductase family enzyme